MLIQYSVQGDYPIIGITWRETSTMLMERCLRQEGELFTRVLVGCTFGKLIGGAGLYSPRFGIEVPFLSAALDLLGLPLEMVDEFRAVDVHSCLACRFGDCRGE